MRKAVFSQVEKRGFSAGSHSHSDRDINLMSWQSSVAQLRRRTELSTCLKVCQSPMVSLSLVSL